MATTDTISFDGWSEDTKAFVPAVAAAWGGLDAAFEFEAGGDADGSRGRPADGLLAAAALSAAAMTEQASASPSVGTFDLSGESRGQAVAADAGDPVGADSFAGDGLSAGAFGFGEEAFGSLDQPQHNGNGATTANVLASGNQQIDGLLSGIRWAGAITYSNPDSAADYQASYNSDDNTNGISAQNEGFSQFSAQQMIAVHFVLSATIYTQPAGAGAFSVQGFTNLDIAYAGAGVGTATLRYANSDDAVTAYAYYPSSGINGGDSFFGPDARTPVAGNYSWMTTIHEMGHSLGLAHGHQGGAFGTLPANVDSHEYSIMTYKSYIGADALSTYNEEFGYPQTYMMLDIAALQYMYGADFTVNAGNTTYTFSPTTGTTFINGVAAIVPGGNRIFNTIWDGNGNDTFDLSNYSTALNVDLRPGMFSVFSTVQLAGLGNGNFARGNVFNALLYNNDVRSLIENVTGGTGNDVIRGNQGSNVLSGGALGTDTLYGEAGNDTLLGGSGIDTLVGGADHDTYLTDGDEIITEAVGGGTDTVYTTGNLTLSANVENGVLYAGFATANTLAGNSGANNLYGNEFANALLGGGGLDFLHGGDGNDIYLIDATGTVVENAGQGFDTVYSVNNLTLGANIEQGALYAGSSTAITIVGNSGANNLYGNEFANTLLSNGGLDYLLGGLGNDTYLIDANGTVVENAGQGIDTVYSVNNLTLGANIEYGVLYAGFNTAQTITGNVEANWLVGNEFGNLLSGLEGNDFLTGGAGGDFFLFEANPGADLIMDFSSFDDQFILRGAAFNLTAGQVLQTGINFIASAAPTVVAATSTILFNTSNGGLYVDPDGTGGIGAILFAGVGGSSVSNLDFMII